MGSAFGFNDSQLRRGAPRQFTAWRARYLFQGDAPNHWHECQVIDVSATGAGLLLTDATAVQVRNRRLVISLHLPATVMNVIETESGLRVGTEFLEISDEERAEIRKMAQLGVRW
jgi:hypothetical protein